MNDMNDMKDMIFIQLHWFYSIPSLRTFKAVVYEIVNRPLQLSPPCRGTHGSTEGKASALVETVGPRKCPKILWIDVIGTSQQMLFCYSLKTIAVFFRS